MSEGQGLNLGGVNFGVTVDLSGLTAGVEALEQFRSALNSTASAQQRSADTGSAAWTKQERATKRALQQMLNLKQQLTRANMPTESIDRVTSAFSRLTSEMSSGRLSVAEYGRSVDAFTAALGRERRAMAAVRPRALGDEVRSLSTTFREFASSVTLAAGPLSGIASRFTAFDSIASAGGIGMAAGVAGVVAAGAGIAELISEGNKLTDLQNKLKLVTTGTQDLVSVEKQLFQQAQQTRNSFDSTADLYSSLTRSTKTLNLTEKQRLDLTKEINQAITISGTSQETAKDALIQLGQAFASGVLRGDELNSVMEETPRLARAIADGLGLTIGQLRQYGKAGKLNAQSVIEALASQSQAIDDEFSKTSETMSQAFTKLKNSLELAVGQMNQAIGLSHALAKGIDAVSKGVDAFSGNTPSQIPQTIQEVRQLKAELKAYQAIAKQVPLTPSGLANYLYATHEVAKIQAELAASQVHELLPVPEFDPKGLANFSAQTDQLQQIVIKAKKISSDAHELFTDQNSPLHEITNPVSVQNQLKQLPATNPFTADPSSIGASNTYKRINDSQQALLDTQDRLNDSQSFYNQLLQETARQQQSLGSLGLDATNTLVSGFASAVASGKSFQSMLADTLKQVSQMILREIILKEVMSAIVGGMGGGFGVPGGQGVDVNLGQLGSYGGYAAKGMAFDHGIRMLANGGLLTGPTLFHTKSGPVIGGEAGTEAVMPLTRTADGRLGVSAAGGASGVEIQIFDQRTAVGSAPIETKETQGANGQRKLQIFIRDTIKAAMSSGELDRTMGINFGVKRKAAR